MHLDTLSGARNAIAAVGVTVNTIESAEDFKIVRNPRAFFCLPFMIIHMPL